MRNHPAQSISFRAFRLRKPEYRPGNGAEQVSSHWQLPSPEGRPFIARGESPWVDSRRASPRREHRRCGRDHRHLPVPYVAFVVLDPAPLQTRHNPS